MVGSASNAAGRYNLRPRECRGQGGLRGAAALADSPLLGRLLGEWSHVLDAKVLPLLDPATRTLLGQVGQACRDAVLRPPKRPCAGRTAGVPLKVEDFVRSVKLLAWAKDNGCPWTVMTCARAAAGGRLEVLQFAREQHCPWDESTCHNAARYGHLAVLQWARQQGCPWWAWGICSGAAEGGHLAVLQWARELGYQWDEDTCVHAAYGGHLECCSGPGSTAAGGTRTLVRTPLVAGTWRCCSGRGSTTARRTSGHARWRQRLVTCWCCSGRGSTAASGTAEPKFAP